LSSPFHVAGLSGAFLIITAAAFLIRLYPLSFSQYPFNNDSITECEIASGIIASGTVNPLSYMSHGTMHSEATPALNILLAYVSSALGVSPFFCSQIVTAVIGMVIVSGMFHLGRVLSGGLPGAVTAGLLAVLFGTFVFTTASGWKVTLGIAMIVILLISFLNRGNFNFRILSCVILVLIPLVHHLATGEVLIMLAFPVAWSIYFAAVGGGFKLRHLQDLLMIGLTGGWAFFYYTSVSLDRFEALSKPMNLLMVVAGFLVLFVIMVLILRKRKHAKMSFAPLVGGGLLAAVVLDYYGLVFPYDPSASDLYVVLVALFALIVGLAWYGAEVAVEKRPVHRSILIGLLLAPLAFLAFALVSGFSQGSQLLVYRSFDFFDLFLFLACAVAVVELARRKNRRYYLIAGAAVIAVSVGTFPFAYDSDLLGVRHDTHGFEVDSLYWVFDHKDKEYPIVTDERFAYISRALLGTSSENSLPSFLIGNYTLSVNYIYVMEDDWITEGVNNFPLGLVKVSPEAFRSAQEISDVMYVGGPGDGRLVVFVGSLVAPFQIQNFQTVP